MDADAPNFARFVAHEAFRGEVQAAEWSCKARPMGLHAKLVQWGSLEGQAYGFYACGFYAYGFRETRCGLTLVYKRVHRTFPRTVKS